MSAAAAAPSSNVSIIIDIPENEPISSLSAIVSDSKTLNSKGAFTASRLQFAIDRFAAAQALTLVTLHGKRTLSEQEVLQKIGDAVLTEFANKVKEQLKATSFKLITNVSGADVIFRLDLDASFDLFDKEKDKLVPQILQSLVNTISRLKNETKDLHKSVTSQLYVSHSIPVTVLDKKVEHAFASKSTRGRGAGCIKSVKFTNGSIELILSGLAALIVAGAKLIDAIANLIVVLRNNNEDEERDEEKDHP